MVAFATRYPDGTELVRARHAVDGIKQETRSDALAGERAARSELDTKVALANKVDDEAVQLRQAAATTADLQQSLYQERERSAALTSELAKVRIGLETTVALSSKSHDEVVQRRQAAEVAAEELRQTLQQERADAGALASELAGTRRGIETQAAQSQKAVDEAVQQKQTAEAATAELRHSLQQEQKKTAALTQEVGAARQAITASAEQQRRALDEAQARAAALASELAGTRLQTQAAQSQKAVDEAVQQKQTAESTIAELRQSLQQERDKIGAMARDHASARRPMGQRATGGDAPDSPISPIVQVTQTAVAVVTKQPTAAGTQDKAEAARLIARASALLGQGNIGAARIVLERAAETGNAQASFMLAETYDPVILSAWGTYGTRGEAAKARELYAKAHTGGIQEAKDRLDALRQ
jgi:septal ring factor EnvC (AmiA/AmiB activator)